MASRRSPHRRPHRRELTMPEWISLAFGHVDDDDAFEDDEDRHEAWLAHRHELMERNGGAVPGHRSAGFWDYDAPDAPAREDFMVPASWQEGERVDSDALEEAQLRYLAERGELRDDELQRLAGDVPAKATWTPEAQHRARRRLDAALEGLAARQHEEAA